MFLKLLILFIIFNILKTTHSSHHPITIEESSRGRFSVHFKNTGIQLPDTYLHNLNLAAVHHTPKPCTSLLHTKLVIIILSAPNHFAKRHAIRHSWGQTAHKMMSTYYFIIGQTLDEDTDTQLYLEQFKYHDLIRPPILDSYRNLTLKSLAMLDWFMKHCSRTDFLLKTDDDVFLNMKSLTNFILTKDPRRHILYGRINKNCSVIRAKHNKNYVSVAEYPSKTFPDYLQGPAYLLPKSVIMHLSSMGEKEPIVMVEDVFITGILRLKLGIELANYKHFIVSHKYLHMHNLNYYFAIHEVSENYQFFYHDMFIL